MEGRKQSELLVNAYIPFLKNCETRFFRVGNRKRLCHLRRVDLGNDFADGFAAKRAMGQSGAVNRATQLELPFANFATSAISEFVFVNRHNKDEQKKTRNEAGNGSRKKSRGAKSRKKTARRASPRRTDRAKPATAGNKKSRRNYQLDFVTPGISPDEASSRKVIRESLKRRMKARRLPETRQRFTRRVGLASRGSIVKPT